MKILVPGKYGPIHRFTDYHVYKTLQILANNDLKGRRQLAREIGIGEGSMRTIIDQLRERKLVVVKKNGIKITAKGIDLLKNIPIELKSVEPTEISMGQYGIAVKIKGKSEQIRTGIEQRDAALKAGADGATTIVYKNGRLIIPSDYDLDSGKPDVAKLIRSLFDLDEGDVIIVGRSSDPKLAERGALAAAFDLL